MFTKILLETCFLLQKFVADLKLKIIIKRRSAKKATESSEPGADRRILFCTFIRVDSLFVGNRSIGTDTKRTDNSRPIIVVCSVSNESVHRVCR